MDLRTSQTSGMKCPSLVSEVLPPQAVPLEGVAQLNSAKLRARREPVLMSALCSAVHIRGMACLRRRVNRRPFASQPRLGWALGTGDAFASREVFNTKPHGSEGLYKEIRFLIS